MNLHFRGLARHTWKSTVLGCAVICMGCGAKVTPTTRPATQANPNLPAREGVDSPKLQLAEDGFPTGSRTPEGAACDLARAFIKRDARLFTATCLRPYCQGQAGTEYREFLDRTVESIHQEAAREQPSPAGPKSIGKVFAARHLTKNGPASYGYAVFDFQDVMFVDVGVFLQNNERSLTRTMVIQVKDGKWYVHPAPLVDSLLSWGLNEESASVQDFSDAYKRAQ